MDVSEKEVSNEFEDWEIRAKALAKVFDDMAWFLPFHDMFQVRREAVEMGTAFRPAIAPLCGRQCCLTWGCGELYLGLKMR